MLDVTANRRANMKRNVLIESKASKERCDIPSSVTRDIFQTFMSSTLIDGEFIGSNCAKMVSPVFVKLSEVRA